jgi:predicted metal-dependent peptidase
VTLDSTRLAAARLVASDAQPFLAAALWAMSPVEQRDLGTFGVDERWRLYIDPDVLERWTVRECARVLLHEVGHLIRDHAARARLMGVDESTSRIWNHAADAEINDDLRSAAVELPEKGVFPKGLGLPEGKTAEFYYHRLLAHADRVFDIPDCGAGCHGQQRDVGVRAGHEHVDDLPPGLDPAEALLVRRRVAEEIVRGIGRRAGTSAGGWERWAAALLHPQIDWRVLLRTRIRSALAAVRGATDYSYRRPSRRRVPGIVMPALEQPLPAVSVVIDTSGSMRADQLDAAWSEVHGALRSLGVRRDLLRVYAGDVSMERIEAIGTQRVVLPGGGGTDMRVGIDMALRGRPRPDLIVVLTDGVTPWPTARPSTRVVVALITDSLDIAAPAWATCVRVRVDDLVEPE